MDSLSISGKQWIYKKFDSSYVNFLKENYFLDEITARLLSIRNIDKKYIDSFLKPSIKNLVPNPNCLRDMDKACQRILEAINRKEKIIDMKGEISPMHLVNAIIQKLSILGPIIVGGEGEGMFSIDFLMTGSSDDPEVESNPLTIIKPRIIERAIEAIESGSTIQ